ncbi:universal stress protein [uncultured Croceitalea sp.]|uniref:universal stress protein n=1 Tax=uncultured Croceitalea sp. TaxID=1798908 RepID=UPI00374F0A47
MLRVLLPTDFSDNSFEAIKYALLAFKDMDCEFYLLHTYMPPVYHVEYVVGYPEQIGLGDVIKQNAVNDLNNLQNKLKEKFKNNRHSFDAFACLGTLTNQVNEMVKDKNINLIVMGTKGATGAREILFGTNTVHIIKRAKCPVIAIPPNFEYEVPKEILFPTDYEVNFKAKPLNLLLKIAKQHVSSIEVLHVSYGYELSDAQKKNKEKLDKILKGIAHLFHDKPNQEVIQAINNFQLKHKMNLLVMIQNKHTFVERLFIEPIIKKIGFHIQIPFMVIPHFK